MKTNHFIISCLLTVLFILSNTHNLTAQININDKSKPINTKSVTENTQLPPEMLEGVEAYREFHLNPQLQTKSAIEIGTEIEFDFWSNNKFKGTVIAVTEYIEGVTGVTAKLKDYDYAYVYMAISDMGTGLSVIIPETNESYQTVQNKQKSYLLKYNKEYIQKRAAFNCGTPDSLPNELQQYQETGESIEAELQVQPTQKSAISLQNAEEEIKVSLMYVYSSAAVEELTMLGRDVNYEVTLSLLESQLVLDNSKTNIKLELSRIHETNYDVHSISRTLEDAIRNNDGEMDEVHTIRDSEEVDIVIVAGKTTFHDNYAGLSYALSSNTGDRLRNAFVAVDFQYVAGNYTVIHEIGHLFGCHHHLTQTCSPAPAYRFYKYGTAWKGLIDNQDCITLMGYGQSNCHGGTWHARIPYFSSPETNLKGIAIGNDSLSDNRRVMKQNKELVSTYGKGMRIHIDNCTTSYGPGLPNIRATIYKQNFDLRSGDRIVYTREPGNVVGVYATTAYIEDVSGNDVTNDPYYAGNLYIYPGTYEITPRKIGSSNLTCKPKVYDGTVKTEIDFSRLYNPGSGVTGILEGDMDYITIDTSEFVVNFQNPNVETAKRSYPTGKIKLTGTKAFCYEYTEQPYYFGTILPAPLTISAKPTEIVLGTNPATVDLSNAYIITGFVNNETISVLGGTLSITIDPAITASSPAGVYPDAIKIQGCTASNYEITYKTADLIIKPSAAHPNVPSELSAEAISSTSVKLTWNIAQQATTYNVKRSTSENGTYTTIATSLTDTTYTNTGLTANTSYWYKVSSQNASGESFDSNPVNVITPPDLLSQTITFSSIPTQNIANATYQLTATASSGLPVSYTSSNTAVATVNASGLITFVSAGTTTITANQAGDATYKAATPVSQQLTINISNDNSLAGLTINSQSWDIQDGYIIGCGNNTERLEIVIATPTHASVWNGTAAIADKKIIFENNNKAFNKDITFQIKAQDGTTQSYTLNVEKYFAFTDIVIQDNNVLTVDNNPSTNGGYSFKSYKWFKNGTPVGDEQSYTESVYDASVTYSVEVITQTNEVLHTCISVIEPIETDSPTTDKIYPNPVQANSTVSINLDSQDATGNVMIEIYNLSGILIKTETITAAPTINFNAPNHQGFYIVKVKAKSKTKKYKLIVK